MAASPGKGLLRYMHNPYKYLFIGNNDSPEGSLAGRLQTLPANLMSPSKINDSDSITKSAIGENVNQFFQNEQNVGKPKNAKQGINNQYNKFYTSDERPLKRIINLLSMRHQTK